MDAKGGYSGEEKTILLCVVTRAEIPHIKALQGNWIPRHF